MKPVTAFATLTLGVLSLTPASAELFRPETVQGALVGGIAGAVIGHNDDRRGWEGAAYGAAAGALVGSVVGQARDYANDVRVRPPVPVSYRSRSWDRGPRWHVGFGYSSGRPAWGWRHDPWSRPAWGWSTRTWSPRYRGYDRDGGGRSYHWRTYVSSGVDLRPSAAARGAFWGGIAGAIIGHNHGRRGWEGAAYGLAGGYLLGSIADARARQIEAERQAAAAWWQAPQPVAPAPAPTQIIINNYSSAPASASPMAAANRAFGR